MAGEAIFVEERVDFFCEINLVRTGQRSHGQGPL